MLKVFLLRLKGDNLGKGKLKYKLTFRDVFIKLFTSRSDFNVLCVMCGFPRSGTHWIRNVVEKSSGLYCPNLEDIDYSKVSVNKKMPVMKIHARSKLVLKIKMFFRLPPHSFQKKYIYVYRDPRDAIISLYNMYNIIKNKNLSQKEFLQIYDPIGQFKWEINSWVLGKKSKNILIIRFEDLKLNSTSTFKQILTFLNIKNEINNEILVTNLQMKSFPIIRYKLGDYIKLAPRNKKCSCGRNHLILEEVTGRIGENVHGKEHKYPSLYFYYIFKNLDKKYKLKLNYQVIQENKGFLTFRIENVLDKSSSKLLSAEINKYFKSDIDYEIIDSVSIESKNGKLKSFISKIK